MNESNYRILLTHTNILHNDPKQKRKMKPYPPLATIQLAALLHSKGFKVDLYDTTFDKNLDAFFKRLKKDKPDALIIYEDYFNYIVKMCLSQMRKVAHEMCVKANEAGITTIVASPDTTPNMLAYIENGADYVVLGEPDITVLETCQMLEADKNPLKNKVKGLAGMMSDNKVVVTGSRPVCLDIESLPMPAWNLIDIESYRKAWLDKHGFFSLNIFSSKGCPYACTWCAKPTWGKNYILKPENHVVSEVKWLIEHYKPDHLWFVDDLFGYNQQWVVDFADLIEKNNLNVGYTIQTRPDLVNPDYIYNLRRSGCSEVWMGAESGSQRILDSMNKMISVDTIKSAVSWLKNAGIRASLFFQFGYLNENMDDIESTVDLIRETFPDDIGISVAYPLAGTDFYRSVKNKMERIDHWKDSDDISMLFKGTYNSLFYKKLHQVLHDELDLLHLLDGDNDVEKSVKDEMLRSLKADWKSLRIMEETHRNGN